MDSAKRSRLASAGFTVGTVAGFLDLTPEESALIELRLALSDGLKRRRSDHHPSQHSLARRIGSSQSRLAKMESGDPGVSLDLLVNALFATGITREQLGEMIAARAAE